jgi:hypothetical protein
MASELAEMGGLFNLPYCDTLEDVFSDEAFFLRTLLKFIRFLEVAGTGLVT